MGSTAEDLTIETMRQSLTETAPIAGKPIQTNTFEEVENKLQEMFAGIDDEHTIANDKPLNGVAAQPASQQEIVPENWTKEKPLQTKAAKKLTESFIKDTTADKPSNHLGKFAKNIGARRRLSVNISPSQLCILGANSEDGGKKSKSKNSNGRNNLNNGKSMEYQDKKTGFSKKSNSKDVNKKKKIRLPANYSSSENESEKPDKKSIPVSDIDSRYCSPYIIVKSDGSVSVINTATTEDINGEHAKVKNSRSYTHHRHNVKGLHTSTLSNKYDADTADSSWICVFCKFGPHKKSQGDLFGPYAITIECEEYKANIKNDGPLNIKNKTNTTTSSPIRKIDSMENVCKDLAATNNHQTEEINSKECGGDMNNIFADSNLGMCRVTDSSYEAWVHEDCAIWAPNIFLVGPRMVGLESAIWNSIQYKCVLCLKSGAAICCLQRDCKVVAHVPCARDLDWALDESSFRSYCQNHKT